MNEWNVRQHKSVQQPPKKKGDTFCPQPQFPFQHSDLSVLVVFLVLFFQQNSGHFGRHVLIRMVFLCNGAFEGWHKAFQKHLRSVVKGHGKLFFVVPMGLFITQLV